MVLIYLNSYSGIVRKGNKALLSSEYAVAQEAFEKAISKNPENPDAYIGLSQVYIAKGDISNTEKVYID